MAVSFLYRFFFPLLFFLSSSPLPLTLVRRINHSDPEPMVLLQVNFVFSDITWPPSLYFTSSPPCSTLFFIPVATWLCSSFELK